MKRHHRAMLMPWTNKVNYTQIVQSTATVNLIAYWPMAEASGTVALDSSGNGRTGAYTGVTLGNTGIGDGRSSAGFDGATSFNNVFTASFQSAFNGAEGSVAAWAQVSAAGVWADGIVREILRIQVDANNYIFLLRGSTNNLLDLRYNAAATLKLLGPTVGPSVAWFHVAMTWSKANDQVIWYINGVQSGATATGLGIFAGVPAATTTVVGAQNTTPLQVWSGNLAHVAVWSTPLSAAQVLKLAVVP